MAQPVVDRVLGRMRWLDPFAKGLQRAVRGAFPGAPGRWLRSLAHGTILLGHPLHPLLTDLPIGAWTVALVAELARVLGAAVPDAVPTWTLGVGAISGVLALLTGYVDYSETAPGLERRTGVAHGLVMTVVLALGVVSWQARLHGAITLSFVALVVLYVLVTLGGYLGGHLVFHRGVQVNFNAFAHGPAKEFVAVGASADFPEGEMKQVKAGPMFVLVVRIDGTLYAIDNACSHAGGPLHKGTRDGFCVTCPWHGSVFDVRTGKVLRGPATAPEPSLLIHEIDGQVEVKLAHPL